MFCVLTSVLNLVERSILRLYQVLYVNLCLYFPIFLFMQLILFNFVSTLQAMLGT